ncbi:HAD family hydrolase [Hyunsoonleella flava]|uniref:phosphoglycolate phosphatase n=1 Tax=Hyunsoonleella flava TaxID=2527939 RepID=A0A4Q9FIX3_9FLAO|nr:HAD family hydrolase [Hyunsoonleella flava]TBN03005.1 HAD family hydrolase [Hyunsoonleella flava]
MTYKAIIFDLDGTLVNSIYDIADAMNTVLKQRNYPTFDYDTYKTFVGHGVKRLIEEAIPQNHLSDTLVNACLSEMMHTYSESCTNKTKPYDGILSLLNSLHDQGVKLSVLSNKEDTLTKKVVRALLPQCLNPVLGLKEEALKKPNPKVALQICSALNVTPEETIYVGDSNVDMQTAKRANMKAVGVSWGFRDKKELVEAGADYILHKPMDLLKIL